MKILGFLFIIIGFMIISKEMVSVGYVAVEVKGFLKYVIAIPQIIFGIYILYTSYKNNKVP
jgi:cadmium resistance protein CadD (predicted permease)